MKEYVVHDVVDDPGDAGTILLEGYLRTFANQGWEVTTIWPKIDGWVRVVLEREREDR